jgi:hypothetical protein
MMEISKRLIGALVISLTCWAGAAMANGLPGGTEVLTFTDGSTMTGFFALTSTNQLVSWNFLYSGGTTLGAETFNSADTTCGLNCVAAPTGLVVSNFNGDEVLTFEENQPNGTRQEFDIAVACGGVANCLTQASTGMTFAVEGPITFPTPCPGQFCIESGLQCVPEGFCTHFLAPGGFINVTDPPGSLAFNVSNTADGTIFNGSGGNNGVPEPSTLLLLGSGIGVLFVLKSRSA